MTNILEAIYNIANQPDFIIKDSHSGRNRANSMGDALENYIKDAFAGTFEIDDKERNIIFNREYSWLGTQNNPPDIMIKNGDAIEVKKIENATSNLALNSSYPKDILRSTNPMITRECKICENWTEKDLIYCIGHIKDNDLKSLWMVYGSIYSAQYETYERIKNTISSGIQTIDNVVFSETKEFARVNRVDPLGITSLRIRGMWQIENPRNVFNYLHPQTNEHSFELIVIIPKNKYDTFPQISINKITTLLTTNSLTMTDEQVKDPNNPAKLINVKLIKFLIKKSNMNGTQTTLHV